MKYWKGTGQKNGQCGTMNDDGYVPDSIECGKAEYDTWVASQPIPIHVPTELELLTIRVKAIEDKIK